MRLDAHLQLRQEMRLKLAPQIIQSIEILQLPLLELRDRIDQELLENPTLEPGPAEAEEAQEDEEPLAEEGEDDEPVEAVVEEPETEPEPIAEEDYEAAEELIRDDEESYRWDRPPPRSGEKDPKRAAIENSPAPEVSLEDHLTWQLTYFDLDPEVREICDNIIANLDWRGYLEYPLEEIAASMDRPVSVEKAQEARYPKVAKAMGCTIGDLKEAVEKIGKLNPIPGALFGEEAAPHVIPDLRVELVDGEYVVMLEDAYLPSLRISSYYARRLQQKGLDSKTEQYLKDKFQSARWLIDAIQQRRSTVFNISTAIVEDQKDFLDKGTLHLKPLKMQDVADQVGVHVSTVSRAISGKYIQTPRGLYSLKHFFTGGVEKEDGEMESWDVVRQKLQHVVDNEDKSDPLSDEQLAAELAKQGIEIARRTVSKYRKLLAIPSSRRRKEY